MKTPIADRLAKLLRLACCETAPDGERLAAVSRLSAIVTTQGLDWDCVLNDNAGPAPPSADDWANAGQSRADEVGNKLSDVEKILKAAAAAEADGVLSEFHIEFCDSLRGRIRDWQTRTFISEKQWNVLKRLRSILERTDYL